MADEPADLPTVRRFEATAFRAWPSASVSYDGTWAVRLTPDSTARRINSINPLDRGDANQIDARIASVRARFEEAGRAPTFRITPLASPALVDHLDRGGWQIVSPSLVMRADLTAMPLVAGDGVTPVTVEQFSGAAIALDNLDPINEAGFCNLIGRIQPEVALFHIAIDGRPAANAICVRDGQVAGLFEVATAAEFRSQGLGRRMVSAAFGWARDRGATIAWLQVEASNATALGLYRSLWFATIYDYHYRTEPNS